VRPCFVLAALSLCGGPVARAAEKPHDVPVSKLGGEYRLVGVLGQPLGTAVTVQGVYESLPGKGHETGPNVVVQRINGRATQEHLQIRVAAFIHAEGLPSLAQGVTYEFEGYETGELFGYPRAALGSSPIPPQAPVPPETGGCYFVPKYVIYKAKKSDPVRWSPADFMGREALIEGRAVSANGKAYIAGDGWWLLVDGQAPWPKHCQDKTVEGHGLIEKTDQPAVFRLEKGTVRLVRLQDQVGLPVTLRGTAWSQNGHWWLQYRGDDLFVEGMERLPGWSSDQHGAPVQISGVLDEAMLPDLHQITTKTSPDLKRYFIVRRPAWKRIDDLLGPERAGP
jgi:hypothetical protein